MQSTIHNTTGAAQQEPLQGGTGHGYPAGVRGDSSAPGYSNVSGIHPGGQSDRYELPVGEAGHPDTTHGASHGGKPSTMDKIKAKLPGSSTTTTTSTTTHSGAHDHQAGLGAHHHAHNNAHGSTPGAYPAGNTQQPSTMDKIVDKVTPGDSVSQQQGARGAQHSAYGTQSANATHGVQQGGAFGTQATHGHQSAYGTQGTHNAGPPSTMEKLADKVTPGSNLNQQQGYGSHATHGSQATHGSHASQGAYGTHGNSHHAAQPTTLEKIADKVTPGNNVHQQHGTHGTQQAAYGTQATHGTHGTQAGYATQPSTMEKIADKVTPGTQYPEQQQQQHHGVGAAHANHGTHNPLSGTTGSAQHGAHVGTQQPGAYSATHNTSQQQHPYGGDVAVGNNMTTKDKIMDKITPGDSTATGTQQHGPGYSQTGTGNQYAAHGATTHGTHGTHGATTHGTHNNTSSNNSGGLLNTIKDKLSSSNK